MSRANWDQLAAFTEMLPMPALVFDDNCRLVAANARALAVLGGEPTEFISKACTRLTDACAGRGAERVKLVRADGTSWILSGPANLTSIGDDSVLLMLLETASPTESEECRGDTNLGELAMRLWQIGVFEHNHLTRAVYACPTMREIYGLGPSQGLTLDSLVDRVHPADRDQVQRQVEAAHDPRGDGQFDIRQRIVRDDGSIRWIQCRAQTTFGEVGGRRGALVTRGTVMDVTESEMLAQELRQSEQRVQQAIKASRVGLYELKSDPSRNGVQTHWSPTMRALLAFPAEGEPDYGWFSSRIHPDDAPVVQAAIVRANDPAGDGLTEAEYRWRHPDGSTRWLMARGTTYFGDVDGQRVPVSAVGAILDVTEQKSAEADRQQRTAILEATPDVVWIATRDGEIVYLNRAGRTFLGLGPTEDPSARSIASLYPPNTAGPILTEGFATAAAKGSWAAEVEFIRHDGTIRPMSQVIIAHRELDGSVERFSTIARDRSRERELEEQFRQAHKMEAVGRLAGGVAHDFNNLLSAITGFTDMARAQLDARHPAVSDLEQVRLAADQAASLTRQLLAFGRRQILQPQVLDLNATLRDMLPMLRQLVDDNIEISMLQSSSAVNIKADPSQVQQIVLNLLVNARDAMPRGGVVTIETGAVTLDRAQVDLKLNLGPGRYAVLAVSDTGSGMDEATRARIFEPFFTTKAAGEGTGLGLSTVFGIVQQSGGSIWVYSEVGRGTTFKIYLPSTDEAPIAKPEVNDPVVTPTEATVLLVDDNEQLRRMATHALGRAGLAVLSAGTPTEALRLARDYPGDIDLLLTDVVMPNMSGRELAVLLLEQRPSMAVLYMSGYTENSIVHHGVLDPGVNFIAKPVTPFRLLNAVQEVLTK